MFKDILDEFMRGILRIVNDKVDAMAIIMITVIFRFERWIVVTASNSVEFLSIRVFLSNFLD